MAPSSTVSRIHHQQALWVVLCSYRALRVQMLAKEVKAKETKVLHVTELQLLFLERFPSPQHCNQPHLTAVAAGPSPSQLEAVSSQLRAVPHSPHLSLGAVSFILYPCKARQSGACTAVCSAAARGGISGAWPPAERAASPPAAPRQRRAQEMQPAEGADHRRLPAWIFSDAAPRKPASFFPSPSSPLSGNGATR